MAASARMVVLLMGAGFGGSYLYTHGDSVLAAFKEASWAGIHELSKPRSKVARGGEVNAQVGGDGKAEAYSSVLADLATQVNKLAAQVKGQSAASQQNPAVMVVSRGGSDKSALVHSVLPASLVVLIVAGVIMRRNGITWSHVAGVTQSVFMKSMDSMQRGLTTVSGALRAVKEDLIERIWRVEEKMQNTNREIQAKIASAVGDARKSVDDVGTQVENLQSNVSGLDNQCGRIDESMQFAVRGVFMLCSYVSDLSNLSSKARSDLGNFLNAAEGAEERARLQDGTSPVLLGGVPDDNMDE
mmetsp:Transcript_12396/g.37834  ORF Transcript_12396/g.37834 Transcript_12396/m.37834 type:complete len:300 (+) Transcript_12396:130-1029(+)